ncbi:MAG: thioredoxin family protein [Gemmatimonadaceae bacterium]|nr:thioredoxin family protein [Gemmatimonadaceae bacterium]
MSALLSAVLGAALACQEPVAAVNANSTYRALFEGGKNFASFLAAAQQRKQQWEGNFRDAAVPDALLTRARAAGGPWKFLVVAVDGCSDSVNTIPYLAKLVQQLMGVELQIIGSDTGRHVMESHRTPDGRAATPTVILLDGNYEERGCWIERPAELQEWMSKGSGSFDGKMKWYDEDKGQKTLSDIVSVMERAAKGERACAAAS